MRIDQALHGITRLAFDTAPIIYFVEANPTYDDLVTNIFNRIRSGELEGRTSVVSLIEVLVQPILARRQDLQTAYRQLLLESPNFQTLPIDATIAESAARMRATMACVSLTLCKFRLRLNLVVRPLFVMTVLCDVSANCQYWSWVILKFDCDTFIAGARQIVSSISRPDVCTGIGR